MQGRGDSLHVEAMVMVVWWGGLHATHVTVLSV